METPRPKIWGFTNPQGMMPMNWKPLQNSDISKAYPHNRT